MEPRLAPVLVLVTAIAASPQVHAQPHFTDVTQGTVLSTLTNPNSEGSSAHGGGIAVLDFDQDGLFDLYLARKSHPNVLLRNLGSWIFEDVTEGSGADGEGTSWIGAMSSDFDEDGYPDLLLLGNEGPRVLLNQGDGRFEAPSYTGLDKPGWPTHHAALGDIDGDGDLDMYVANHTREMEVFSNGPPDISELDKDTCTGNALYLQDRPNHWVDQGYQLGVDNIGCTLSVAMTDLDGDGWLDLYADNDRGPQIEPDALFWSEGVSSDGKPAPYTRDPTVRPSITGMGIAIADWNRDGDLDFFLSNTTTNKFYDNAGPRTFVEIGRTNGIEPTFEPKVSWGVAFEDFDLDGWPDVWAVNTQPQNSFYWNMGDGSFKFPMDAIPLERQDTAAQFGLAWADLDNDGDLDIVTGGLGGEPGDEHADRAGPAYFLYRNDQQQPHHWLQVTLQATTHHSSAVGARISVTVDGDTTQLQEVTGGTSYASSGWPVETFGLGTADRIDRLAVAWPGGRVEVLHDLEVDQRIHLVEGTLWDTGLADTAADTADPLFGPEEDDPQGRFGGCSATPRSPSPLGLLLLGLLANGRRRRSP